mgnify:CR=1 FL=1
MIGNLEAIRQFVVKINASNYTDEFLKEIRSLIIENEQEFRNELYACNLNKSFRYWYLEDQIHNFKWDIDKYNYINLGFVKSAKIRKEFPIITKIMGCRNRKIINPLE